MLILRDVCKTYGELSVLKEVNLELASDGIYCLMAPSGYGKTTLLRLILGLEKADSGEIRRDVSNSPKNTFERRSCYYSAVFQEDRLCEDFSPLDNLVLTCGKTLTREQLVQEMCCLLPEESIRRPVRTLSGGMKRRVAILRAMLASSQVILMDEPFSGLDEDMRHTVIRYILEHRKNRLLLVTTHQEEDVELLGARLIRLSDCP
ncbi:MAG: ATP-binding cassette domain-containing protein [Clostridiales bacterium]|nr:ATP-binding cassette domain-containing protein [Clostridiales bacterium]